MAARTYFFNKCIRRTIIQFLDVFNNINIERYDVNGTVRGRYLVPLRYGPKSKSYMFLHEHDRDEEMLPMMSVYMTGIDFDPNRLTNKYQDIVVNKENLSGTFAKNAIPYNITFTVNVWALHMVDIDQIYEQILPFFQPHAFIRVRIPEIDIAFDVKVILESCSSVMTDDVGEEDNRVIKWDTVFNVQTWLFKPTETKDLIGIIGGVFGTSGTSGYNWTSGMGTTGFGSGTSGKIVNRYYMDEDTFYDRDNPEAEIFADERPSETVAFRQVGVDAENKIILDYEVW